MFANIGSAALAGSCAGCLQPMRDATFIQTGSLRWHLSCLRCAECCQSAVDGTSRIERNDRVYCKPCYIRVFLSTCTACKKPITGEVTSAHDRLFHPVCFSCRHCMQPIDAGEVFVLRGSDLYCQPCHSDILAAPIMPQSPGTPQLHRESKKRVRTLIQEDSRLVLKRAFEMNPAPDAETRRILSAQTGLPARVVQVWFQNQRAEKRKQDPASSMDYSPPFVDLSDELDGQAYAAQQIDGDRVQTTDFRKAALQTPVSLPGLWPGTLLNEPSLPSAVSLDDLLALATLSAPSTNDSKSPLGNLERQGTAQTATACPSDLDKLLADLLAPQPQAQVEPDLIASLLDDSMLTLALQSDLGKQRPASPPPWDRPAGIGSPGPLLLSQRRRHKPYEPMSPRIDHERSLSSASADFGSPVGTPTLRPCIREFSSLKLSDTAPGSPAAAPSEPSERRGNIWTSMDKVTLSQF